MHALRPILCLFCWLLLPYWAQCQEWLGLSVSSFTGVHAALANPAMLGVQRMRLQVGTVAANSQLNTNVFTYVGPRNGGLVFKGFGVLGETYGGIKNSNLGTGIQSVFSRDKWQWVNDDKPKYFSITGEVRGPFIAGTFGKFGWGIGYRLRTGLQVQDISPALASLLFANQQNDASSFINKRLNEEPFAASINAHHEFYGIFGFPILQLGPHYLAGGATLKYLAGMYAAAITSKGLNYTFVENDSLRTTEANVTYQYIDNPVFAADPTAARGGGGGVDLGVVYELRNTNLSGAQYAVGQGTHKLRAGLSLLDAGRISYTNAARRFDFKNTNIPTSWGQLDTLRLKGAAELDSAFSQVFGSQNQGNAFYTGLPTVLNVFGDLQIIQYFYISAMASQRVSTVSKAGVRAFSSFTILPRLEHRQVEVGLPLTISTRYGTLLPGFYFRVSGFFMGSDNMATLFSADNRAGLSLYMGGYVPMRK